MTFTGLRSLRFLPLHAGAPLAGQTMSPAVAGILTDTDGRPLATALVAVVWTTTRVELRLRDMGPYTYCTALTVVAWPLR
jgi:hypothetical protein